MALTELFSGIPVSDFETMVDWYERLWGRPPDFYPKPGEAVWQLTGHGWVYVVQDADRAGNGLMTLLVDDLELLISELESREIDPGKVKELGPSVPGIVLTDSDGNRISFGQPPAESGESA